MLSPVHSPPQDSPWNLNELADLIDAEVLTAAVVLIGLVMRNGALHVLLTRRRAELKHHGGQVAFPGGRVDSVDASAYAAVLRETAEEVGIAAQFIRPLGWHLPYATITGFNVLPLVAELDPGFCLCLSEHEVDAAFEAPLSLFLDPSCRRLETGLFRGRQLSTHVFDFHGFRIWGATAAMLVRLADAMNQIHPIDRNNQTQTTTQLWQPTAVNKERLP
jgi:8-oxo-dGTP pyrophosphatase MutT (NUDIX family)